MELVEIGPRFTLTPIAMFKNSFCGSVLYKNPNYISPNHVFLIFIYIFLGSINAKKK